MSDIGQGSRSKKIKESQKNKTNHTQPPTHSPDTCSKRVKTKKKTAVKINHYPPLFWGALALLQERTRTSSKKDARYRVPMTPHPTCTARLDRSLGSRRGFFFFFWHHDENTTGKPPRPPLLVCRGDGVDSTSVGVAAADERRCCCCC